VVASAKSGPVALASRVAVDANDYMGETPVWSPQEQALYWINCEEPARVRRWDPATGALDSWPMPERIGGLALRRNGGPIVCLASGIFNLHLASGKLSLLAPSPYPAHVKLHESCVDRSGRLWVGAFDTSFGATNLWPGGAAFCRLDGNTLVPMVIGMSITNSLAFSPDGARMYFCDTLRRVIWQAALDPGTGAIRGIHEFVRLEESVTSDGAAVDADGGYWLAIYGGAQVRRYLPSGKLDRVLELPFSQPTKPAFGGPDLRKLYVTSTQIEVPGFAQHGRNGVVQEADVDVAGLAEVYFAG
jgi:L-arabinonolactonase